MKKRIFTFFLSFIIMLGIMPIEAFAYIGPVRSKTVQSAIRAGSDEYGNYLKNDYITFYVIDPKIHADVWDKSDIRYNLITSTAPTREIEKEGGYLSVALTTGMTWHKYSIVDYGSNPDGRGSGKDLVIRNISVVPDNSGDNSSITAKLTFDDKRITAEVKFWIERVNKGANSGTKEGSGTKNHYLTYLADNSTSDNTWGVRSHTTFKIANAYRNEKMFISPTEGVVFQIRNMGHTSEASMIKLGYTDRTRGSIFASDSPSYDEHSSMNITGGLARTSCDVNGRMYTEVFTDCYRSANPFVAFGSSFYNYEKWNPFDPDYEGVEGFDDVNFADEVEYPGRNDMTTYAHGGGIGMFGDNTAEFSTFETYTDGFWGYRDLYAASDSKAPTNADEVEITEANVIGIFQSGSGYKTLSAENNTDLEAQRKRAGFSGAVAVIRGKNKLENGYYVFEKGAAALSSTVTAVWDKKNGYFKIDKDSGRFVQKGVNLNAPTFKFFMPDNADTAMSIKPTADGLEVDMAPEHNKATVYVDIPYVKSKLETGTIKPNGNLIFKGEMGFETVFDGAKFTLEKLGYGIKNNEFVNIGVKCNGEFDTGDLMGLDLASVKGTINTFKDDSNDPERYQFELSLDVFDMFKTGAELDLVRVKNGSLIPNKLFFEVSTTPGIILCPPAPLHQLNGGGGGFDNLAATVNGDYFAIPPIKLLMRVKGTYLHTVQGTVDLTVGPSQFELKGSNLHIVGIDQLNGITAAVGVMLNGDTRGFKNVKYKGLELKGYYDISTTLPNKKWDIIDVNTHMDMGGFGGLNEDKTKLYLLVFGNAKTSASLQFPSDWDIVGGKKIAGADLDMTAGIQTAFPIRGTDLLGAMDEALKNADVYVGACATFQTCIADGRVWAVLPDCALYALDAKPKPSDGYVGWGYDYSVFTSLDEWDWTHVLNQRTRTYSARTMSSSGPIMPLALTDPEPGVGLDPGTVMPLAAVDPATDPATDPTTDPIVDSLASRAASLETTVINVSANTGETGFIKLRFDYDVSDDDIKKNLVITDSLNSPFAFNWAADYNDLYANAIISDHTDEDGSLAKVVVIKVPNGSYTVSAGVLQCFYGSGTVAPLDSLSASFSGNTVTGQVEHPVTGKKYSLATYLAAEEGGKDYLVDVTEISNPSSISVSIPSSGTVAPTGNYYVTTLLIETKKGVTVNSLTGQTEDIMLTIDKAASTSAVANYTNNVAPSDPTSVTLKADGNETMVASWTASECDGFKVTIYEQDSTGWKDTGFGYEFDKADFEGTSKKNGLSNSAGTYSIDMAMTAGNTGNEEIGTMSLLSANKTYKVGVSAYKTEKSNTEGISDMRYYSGETTSAEAYLPKYQELNDIVLEYNGTAVNANENGVYEVHAGRSGGTLTASSALATKLELRDINSVYARSKRTRTERRYTARIQQ